jgi:hypothetical protein
MRGLKALLVPVDKQKSEAGERRELNRVNWNFIFRMKIIEIKNGKASWISQEWRRQRRPRLSAEIFML